MKYDNIIPAIPGTTVTHYNGFSDTTQEEPVLFWGVGREDDDDTPYITPFTLIVEGCCATPLYIPEGGNDGRESGILAFNIPGWGLIDTEDESLRRVKVCDLSLGKSKNLAE